MTYGSLLPMGWPNSPQPREEWAKFKKIKFHLLTALFVINHTDTLCPLVGYPFNFNMSIMKNCLYQGYIQEESASFKWPTPPQSPLICSYKRLMQLNNQEKMTKGLEWPGCFQSWNLCQYECSPFNT